jgi:hypothetical protein
MTHLLVVVGIHKNWVTPFGGCGMSIALKQHVDFATIDVVVDCLPRLIQTNVIAGVSYSSLQRDLMTGNAPYTQPMQEARGSSP